MDTPPLNSGNFVAHWNRFCTGILLFFDISTRDLVHHVFCGPFPPFLSRYFAIFFLRNSTRNLLLEVFWYSWYFVFLLASPNKYSDVKDDSFIFIIYLYQITCKIITSFNPSFNNIIFRPKYFLIKLSYDYIIFWSNYLLIKISLDQISYRTFFPLVHQILQQQRLCDFFGPYTSDFEYLIVLNVNTNGLNS